MSKKIPVILCHTNILSGVTSWGEKLRDAFDNHPDYEVMLVKLWKQTPSDPHKFDFNLHTVKEAQAVFEKLAPAIIIPNYNWFVMPKKLKNDLRYIGLCHSDSVTEYYEPLEEHQAHFSKLIAVSPTCSNELKSRLPARSNDIFCLPYGVEIPADNNREYQTDPIRLVYGGRVVQQQKRIFDFIPLIKSLLNKRVAFTFDIVGDGPDLVELKNRILSENLLPHVRFLGKRLPEQMASIWRQHDVFIQVSDYEGTSISMLESMAQGVVPVVTAASSGVSNVIQNGKNGYIVPVGDMEQMADAIAMIAKDLNHLSKLGNGAYENAKHFNMDKYVQKFSAILDSTRLVAKRPKPLTSIPAQQAPVLMQANNLKGERTKVQLASSYLVCTAHRTGSNLLNELLTQTGVAGFPAEFFYKDFQEEWSAKYSISSFAEYVEKIPTMTCTPNGVFGAKIMAGEHFNGFLNQLKELPRFKGQELSDAQIIHKLFPNTKYIWLTRRDKVRQAISFYKAVITGKWASNERARQTEFTSDNLQFNFDSIHHQMVKYTLYDAMWQQFFNKASVKPLTIIYEDFVTSKEETVKSVLNYLNIPIPKNLQIREAEHRKLANHTTEVWVNKYYAELMQRNRSFENELTLQTKEYEEEKQELDYANLEKLQAKYKLPRSGTISLSEIKFIWSHIKEEKPTCYLELGVASGFSTAFTLLAMDTLFPSSSLIGIDINDKWYLDPKRKTGYLVDEIIGTPKCNYELYTKNWIADLEEILNGRKVDLAFIDGNHAHPWALIDTILLLPFLQQGTVVIYHDVSLYKKDPGGISPYHVFANINDEKIQVSKPTYENIGAIRFNKAPQSYEKELISIIKKDWTIPTPLSDYFIKPILEVVKKYYSPKFYSEFANALKKQNTKLQLADGVSE